MMYLQERDIKLLKMIAAYGILNNESIRRIYDDSSQYYIRRKKTLADAKYIIKTNKYAYMGIKEKRYLESIGETDLKQISGDKYARERLEKISEVLIPLQNVYECYPSWKLKDIEKLAGRKLQSYGKIRSRITEKEYYIYNLGTLKQGKNISSHIKIKAAYIKHIKEEIVQNALIWRR
ncbi:hypothetical protein Ccar_17860 [Clostridium carboxidivorans P7]|uniref:Uncharacterized protein n=1 Tax=Clostridium carboxidivorans P7 TaxID=536227 RepID=C6PSC7_9CLOT|nr:hypothetical protein [Clostridium carboxidivorans]AKN32611.1 hypothetical protein Ccar_17860 [Clostridium carboxidivorans P7]EET87805.1 hypothetical protein CcarbDRAFT_1694 [Clostridium carboxidivorans P7]EFG90176.1 hypothetical protein CLCAR_0382 [Clostridium carboxidivorans P7]